jgi:hypothetical protein
MAGFARTESMRKAKVAGGPWQDILTLADDDGWLCVFDPTNPNTRTLRNSGGTDYVTQIADGLGNVSALVQATEANQLALVPGAFGDLDGMTMGATTFMRSASNFPTQLSHPCIWLQIRRLDSFDNLGIKSSATSNTTSDEMMVYSENFSWGGYPGLFAGAGLVAGSRTLDIEVISGLFNGASSKVFRNGTQLGSTGNTGTRRARGVTIGANPDNSGYFWIGRLGLLMIRDDGDETAMQDMVTEVLSHM